MITIVVYVFLVELVEQSSLCEHTCTDEIAHILCSTADRHVMLGLKGDILHYIVCPTGVRESDWVATSAELLDDSVGESCARTVVGEHLVIECGIIVRRCLLNHLGGSKC